jgi:shikimate kinase
VTLPTAPLPNIVLVGFMGTGKSTVGPIVAGRLGRTFVDTDLLIEERTGLTVPEIFARLGEPAFRTLERTICRDVAHLHNMVIAVGGGAILDPTNRGGLESSGVLILLTCNADTIISRVRKSVQRGERPLLSKDFRQQVHDLLTARQPIYSSVSLQIDTTGMTPEEVAQRVCELYAGALAPQSGGQSA